MQSSATRCVHIITGLEPGGAEKVLYRLLAHQDRERWPSRVISLTDRGALGDAIEAMGVVVHTLDMPRGRFSLRAYRRLTQLLRAEKPAIVQTWMYHANLLGGLAARQAGVKNIVWGLHHTTLDPETEKRSTILVARAGAWLSGSVPRRIICCSQATFKTHLQYGYAAGKMVVIPNGYDLERFQPDPAAPAKLRRELGLDSDVRLIGMAARYHPLKDHGTFFEAARRLAQQHADVHYVLCGAGIDVDNDALMRMIDAAGLTDRVHLLGLRTDMPAFFAALDVATLTSRGEGFPNVVAEAMACGVPAVVTDVGDAPEIVGDAGWVVPTGDPETLINGWRKALTISRYDKTELSRRARARVEAQFSIEKMVVLYEDVCRWVSW